MNPPPDALDLFGRIESLQDEVLSELDELNRRIESTLAQHGVVSSSDETTADGRG